MQQLTQILIAEDDVVIAYQLKYQLEAFGYGVVGIASRGDTAVNLALSLRPDLVVMDIQLEGPIDGIEAARQIMKYRQTPVVYLTAYSADEILQRAKASAPYGYLVKPYDPRELHATIQVALSRRRTEIDNEFMRERLLLAVDAAQLGVWEWDAATASFSVAGHLEPLLAAAEPGGDYLAQFLAQIHPGDRAGIEKAFATTLIDGGLMRETIRIDGPNGSHHYLEMHGKSFPGRVVGTSRMIGVLRDVTESAEQERELRLAHAVFEAAAEGILVLDTDAKVVAVNPAFEALTGYSAEEVLGRRPDTLFYARRHDDWSFGELQGPAAGPWHSDHDCLHKDGTHFSVSQSVSPVRDANGIVTQFVVIIRDVSALRYTESKLDHLSHHDMLTGLLNRTYLDQQLPALLATLQPDRDRCAVLIVDLDRFRVINDTLGPTSGDRILQAVANRLKSCVRECDTVARFGGDQFVVLAGTLAQPEDGALLAGKLLSALAVPVAIGDEQFAVSASIGISLYPDDGDDRDSLMKAAENAVHQAKTSGRNRYHHFSADMAARAAERLFVDQGLRRAIQDDQLVLHYQPVVSLMTGTRVGLEALVRWPLPDGDLMGPDRFIPIAEETGLINPLGRWVAQTACREVRAWERAAALPLRLSINVSAHQLVRDLFTDVLSDALNASGFPPDQLEIEITESTLQSLERSRGILEALKALGISIAIDDFGTGYSSLSVLKHLPIDRLKIDRSFVRDLPQDANDTAIVEAIIAMAHKLGVTVVAEGIETEAQSALLRQLGCDEGQGYYFGRPVPAGALATSLQPVAEPTGLPRE